MIDTLKAQFHGVLKKDWEKNIPTSFEFKRLTNEQLTPDEEQTFTTNQSISMIHKASGARIFVPEMGGFGSIEASLPKMMHGENSHIIKSEKEIQDTWATMKDMCGDFMDLSPVNNGDMFNITRVDACWHVNGKPSDVLNLHRYAKHPKVRKSSVFYEGESIHFPGTERHLRIYDKGKEQRKTPDTICRVELQLRTKALRKEHGLELGEHLQDPNGEMAYDILRRFCWQFQDVKYSQSPHLLGILARAVALEQTWNDTDEFIYETWKRDKSRSSVHRMNKKITAYNLDSQYSTFSWKDQLPSDHRQETMELEV